jgi:hypothetical protein
MRWWDRRCQHHSLIKLYNNQMQKAGAGAECKGDAVFPASDLKRWAGSSAGGRRHTRRCHRVVSWSSVGPPGGRVRPSGLLS